MAKKKTIKNVAKLGKTLWFEMELKVSKREIDEFYRDFRLNLKIAIDRGFLLKEGTEMKPAKHAAIAGTMSLPTDKGLCRVFTLADVMESKRIFKRHKDRFAAFIAANTKNVYGRTHGDWNDLKAFHKLLVKLKVRKPMLIAQLIFGAWTHPNKNVCPFFRRNRKS